MGRRRTRRKGAKGQRGRGLGLGGVSGGHEPVAVVPRVPDVLGRKPWRPLQPVPAEISALLLRPRRLHKEVEPARVLATMGRVERWTRKIGVRGVALGAWEPTREILARATRHLGGRPVSGRRPPPRWGGAGRSGEEGEAGGAGDSHPLYPGKVVA